MRDTRKARNMLVIALSAAVGAVLGDMYIRPMFSKAIKG